MLRIARQWFAATKAVQTEVKGSAQKQVSFYKNGELVNRSALTLKKQEDVQAYVLKTIRGYFRTTYKEGLQMTSSLQVHGLDSLDAIEICMQIQEDLGYQISGESLPGFTKVSHFVNYINTTEQYKSQHGKAPLP